MTDLVELIKTYTGKKGLIDLDNLKVEVQIIQVKNSYGNIRFLVTPVAGSGKVWKEKVTLIKE